MSGNRKWLQPDGLTISYKKLGTVSIDEWIHPFLEDMQMLKQEFNAGYVKVQRIKMHVTNEYGEEVKLCRPGGPRIHFMYTNHYRSSCMDYEL